MTKKTKKALLWVASGVMLSSTLILGVSTIVLSQSGNQKEDQGAPEANPSQPDAGAQQNQGGASEDWPETATELKNRKYPFADDANYLYQYANIHAYFYSNPEWDQLISYRYLLSDYDDHYQQFSIQQDVLYKNLQFWIVSAIYQHPFFKQKSGELSLETDYRVNQTQKNILINAV